MSYRALSAALTGRDPSRPRDRLMARLSAPVGLLLRVIAFASLAGVASLALGPAVAAARAIAAEPPIFAQEGETYSLGTRVTGPCDPGGDPDTGTTSEIIYEGYRDGPYRDYRDLHNDWANDGGPSGGWWVRPWRLRDADGRLLPKCAPLTLRHPGRYAMRTYNEGSDDHGPVIHFEAAEDALSAGFICFSQSGVAAHGRVARSAITSSAPRQRYRGRNHTCSFRHKPQRRDFASCAEFRAWSNRNWAASSYYQFQVKWEAKARRNAPHVHDVVITYLLDRQTTYVGEPVYTWPDMTEKEKQALAKTLEALSVHEHGHLTLAARFAAKYTDKFTARSSAEVTTLIEKYRKRFAARLEKEQAKYDRITAHGARQSMGPSHGYPGGDNVEVACP